MYVFFNSYGIKSSRLGRYVNAVANPMISEDDMKEVSVCYI